MKFSLNWLKKHLDTQLNLQQISDALTSIGLEVEEVQDPAEKFKNFKLVEIQKIENHPDADKLHLCTVRDADCNDVRIVCGAQNVRVGLKTILATEGAYIPGGDFILKKSKIRGIVSEGMMCSREELALPEVEDGIIDLPADTDLSTSVGDILGYEGGVIEVSLTPDRGDCFSVKGIARDLAAAGCGKFIEALNVKCNSENKFSLSINKAKSAMIDNCIPTASFRIIRNINNRIETPDWLKNELKLAGLNRISPVVDLANWLMLDSGRPLHIYDIDKIEGNINIRFANAKEEFVDLKGDKHELRDDMLIVLDDNDVLCVMGVMGGQKTACTEDTKNILIESALLDAISVSKTGSFLNLVSDSRTRFERGIDANSCLPGIENITKLILDNCGGECSEIFSFGEISANAQPIELHKENLRHISGCDIEWNQAINILEKLGLTKIEDNQEVAKFVVPTWRSDLAIEEDLVAEILRIYGYSNIEECALNPQIAGSDPKWNEISHQMAIKRLLTSRQLSEVVAYEFTKDAYAEAFKRNNKLIYLINPISNDLNTMRPSLLPNLLTTAIRSLNFRKTSVKLFEVGHVFFNDCEQRTQITGLRIGNYSERNWLNKNRNADVFDVKADAIAVLQFCGISEKNIICENKAPDYYHPYRSATLSRGKQILGYFGELHPRITKLFGITERVLCFELNFDEFATSRVKKAMFAEKVFPKINRDFAFLFNARIPVGSIINAIQKISPIISEVSVFDNFDMNDGKISIGISVALDAKDRTLTEDEAQQLSDKIIKFVESKGGELRSK